MIDYGITSSETQELAEKLFSSLLIEQKKFQNIAPPLPEKKKILEDLLDKYAKQKGRPSFYNYLSSGRGHGPFSELVDGSIKYDLIGGIGVGILGHSHPLHIRAHIESAMSDTVMCGNLLPYPEATELTEEILQSVSKTRLKHFWFSGSGSFANDTALKILWQKTAPHYRIFAFEKGFAGRSVATQEITYNSAYREGMPQLLNIDHIPHFDSHSPKTALKKTIKALEDAWNKNPGEFSAITFELIQGEAGFIYRTKEYYEGVCKWAKEKKLFIWIDEVQTFGRTTELFAFQMFGLDDYVDIVTVGKALQTCGVLYTEDLNPRPGLIAGTFNGSLSALNAGKKTIRYLLDGPFYGPQGKIANIEKVFKEKLTGLSDLIGEIHGIGTMISFELIPNSKENTIKFIKLLFDNGIIAFMAGENPTRVRFLLPVCLTEEHIEEIFSIMKKTLIQLREGA